MSEELEIGPGCVDHYAALSILKFELGRQEVLLSNSLLAAMDEGEVWSGELYTVRRAGVRGFKWLQVSPRTDVPWLTRAVARCRLVYRIWRSMP